MDFHIQPDFPTSHGYIPATNVNVNEWFYWTKWHYLFLVLRLGGPLENQWRLHYLYHFLGIGNIQIDVAILHVWKGMTNMSNRLGKVGFLSVFSNPLVATNKIRDSMKNNDVGALSRALKYWNYILLWQNNNVTLCFAVVMTCEVRSKVKKTNAYHSHSSATSKQLAIICLRMENTWRSIYGKKIECLYVGEWPLGRTSDRAHALIHGLKFHSALL